MKVFSVGTKHQFGLLKIGGLATTGLHRKESKKFES